MIGIDVDHYGDKRGGDQLQRWAEEWGPLPPTYVSTSRDDGVSGIRLYRVPDDFVSIGGVPWIELIQRHHRLVMAAPSQHHSGRDYRWIVQDPALPPLIVHEHLQLPEVAALPWLPEVYVIGLAKATKTTRPRAKGKRSVAPSHGSDQPADYDLGELLTDGDPCSAMSKELARYAAEPETSRYDSMRDRQMALFRQGHQRHDGAEKALAALFESYRADRGELRDVLAEWDRARDGAVAEILENPTPEADRNGCAGKGGCGTKVTKDRRVRATKASSMTPRATRWLWKEDGHHWLPLGGLVLLGGREGVGKTTIAYQIAAKITRGELPGAFYGTPRGVIISATEDAWEETVLPRLLACEADLDRVDRVDAVTAEDLAEAVTLPEDIAGMEKLIRSEDVALSLLDPLMGSISGTLDSHKDHEVRRALEPRA